MQHFRFLLFLLSAFFLLSAQDAGCRRKSSTGLPPVTPAGQPRAAAFLREKLEQAQFRQISRLSAAARVVYDDGGQRISANANLIWVRDSMLWLNVKKLGIEVARVLITPDSVRMLNRLDKTCTARSVHDLQRRYGLPGGFEAIQRTLLGSAWLLPGLDWRSDVADGQHRILGSDAAWAAEYRLDEGPYWLRRESFLQKMENRSAILNFDDHRVLPQGGYLPYLRRIETFSPQTGGLSLEIELSNVEINVPKTWRFDIPAHYERLD
ncbi:MAG TPA: DUF4292 domain-containing protein [Saprospiraceae bacterium]|nr:DUF4292 domain-containing protein [Saprospiraceae bacterium]HND88235.1 DUF4292 domain-containing protein [Saprospiraceae bacterium]HNG89241.1 DUF4292 domain-containing protein [Saprospiraceae bacterium]